MNDARANWVSLVNECKKCGLPSPEFFPAPSGTTFQCSIPGIWKSYDKDPVKAILPALDFVSGYSYHMNKEVNPPEPLAKAALLAKKVINGDGLGGPEDHELLANSILHLTVHLLEHKNE